MIHTIRFTGIHYIYLQYTSCFVN